MRSDNLPTQFFKLCIDGIRIALFFIFNESFLKGHFSNIWKKHKLLQFLNPGIDILLKTIIQYQN